MAHWRVREDEDWDTWDVEADSHQDAAEKATGHLQSRGDGIVYDGQWWDVVVVPLDRPGGEVQGTEQYHYRVEAHVTFDFAVRYRRMETRDDGDAG